MNKPEKRLGLAHIFFKCLFVGLLLDSKSRDPFSRLPVRSQQLDEHTIGAHSEAGVSPYWKSWNPPDPRPWPGIACRVLRIPTLISSLC